MEKIMESFESIQETELSEFLLGKQEILLTVKEATVGFRADLPDADFSNPKEVPPTSVILTPQGIAQIFAYSGATISGKFLRFVAVVYASGGKIHYRLLSNGDYEAHVTWPS